jgi:hypothetical protein
MLTETARAAVEEGVFIRSWHLEILGLKKDKD